MTIPGVPAGTTNAEMPSSVRAVTVTIEVMSVPQLVMNALDPLITHSSPTSSARVRVAPASEPPSGSVRPNAPSARPATQVGQPLVVLVVVTEPEDRVRAEPDAGRQGDPHRLIDSTHLLDRHAQRREVAAAAAPSFGEDDAEQSEIAHRPDHLGRETTGSIPLGCVWCDLLCGELTHRHAQHLVIVAQLPSHEPSTLPKATTRRPFLCCPATVGPPRVLSPPCSPAPFALPARASSLRLHCSSSPAPTSPRRPVTSRRRR